jgi:hypothetical protein
MRPLKDWSWTEGKLSGSGIPFTCTAPLQGTKIALDCDGLPSDSKISVRGGEPQSASGKFHLDIDVGDALGAVSVKDFVTIGFELDPKIPLVIVIPKGTVKTELPKIKSPKVGLKGGAGKPMPFGNEPAAAPNPAGPTVLWMGTEGEAFGPATTLREVEWVAAEAGSKITDGPTCKYQDPQTGKISTAPLNVHATEAIIYDRRTARVVDRNLFKPLVSCPVQKLKTQDAVHASVSEDVMKRWVQERRTKR